MIISITFKEYGAIELALSGGRLYGYPDDADLTKAPTVDELAQYHQLYNLPEVTGMLLNSAHRETQTIAWGILKAHKEAKSGRAANA